MDERIGYILKEKVNRREMKKQWKNGDGPFEHVHVWDRAICAHDLSQQKSRRKLMNHVCTWACEPMYTTNHQLRIIK